MNHFDEMTALDYLEGQLDEARASETARHAASCDECGKLLRALERESLWLREALTGEEEPFPSSLIAAPRTPVAPWAWAATIGSGAAGLYTLWSALLDSWQGPVSQIGFTQGSLLTTLFFAGAFWKGWDSMLVLSEFLAAVTLGILAIWLLQGGWRRSKVVPVAMTALLCLLAWPSPARAAEIERGHPNYTLPAGQEVHTDLIVTGANAEIDGDVDGDVILLSRTAAVNGHVKGDVIVFSQYVLVNGPVDGNVRAFGEALTLNGPVAKNAMAWARDVDMDRNARVGGTMTLGSNDADLGGQINGDLLALASLVNIGGSVGGNATVRGGRLLIGPAASVAGHVTYRGRRKPEISAGAKLASPIHVIPLARPRSRYASPRYYWRQILAWGASFLFGLVLFWVAPGFFLDVENTSRRFGASAGLGVVFLVAIPFAAVIACVTIVGLGVGLTVLLFYGIALYAAQVFIGAWLGEKLLGPGVGAGRAMGTIAGRLALGLAILRILRILPFAGGLIEFIIVIWGLGALVLTLYRKLRPQLPATA